MTMQERLIQEEHQGNALWNEGDQSWKQKDPRAVWREEIAKVTDELVALVQPPTNPVSGKGPYAPRLELLTLNGNDLYWQNVKRIVEAIVKGNSSLCLVELFATYEEGSTENDGNQASLAPTSRPLRRSGSTGNAFAQRRQQQRDFRLADKQSDANTIASRSKNNIRQDNWRHILSLHLWRNKKGKIAVKDASRRLLSPARILTCKCREADHQQASNSYFPISRLPPELRRRILAHLDTSNVLSNRQIEQIFSYASDATTIGYGARSKDCGVTKSIKDAIAQELRGTKTDTQSAGNDYGMIPHRPWSWVNMIRYHTSPRDWPATVLDEITHMSIPSLELERPAEDGAENELRGYRALPMDEQNRQWRVWLEEQSDLQAFWEATGTYRAEWMTDP